MFNNEKWESKNSFLSYNHLKPKLRVFLTGYTVAMETSEVKKVTETYSAIIGHSFNTIDISSKCKSWKVLETITSHLK